jgi:hypothetical protein
VVKRGDIESRLRLYKCLFTKEREIPQGSNEDCVCVFYAIRGLEGSKRSCPSQSAYSSTSVY